jgi:hypothetical protein
VDKAALYGHRHIDVNEIRLAPFALAWGAALSSDNVIPPPTVAALEPPR